jgi:hypothetical protein
MEKQKPSALEVNQIRLRLAFAFGLLISIVIAVGWLGLARMEKANRDLENLIGGPWATAETSRKALSLSATNNRITMEVFLLDDQKEIEQLLAVRAENTRKISALLDQIEKQGIDSKEEREVFDAVKATRTPYVESYKHALDLLLKEHKPAQARAIMVGTTIPRLRAYHEAWSAFVDFQGKQMDAVAHLISKESLGERIHLLDG